jgi:predicted ArsR family transcriptional regulator
MAQKITRPCKAIRLTERDLRRLDDHVEKCALALGERFGEVDGGLERLADDLLRMTREWADEVRSYMRDRNETEGETWQL